MIIILTAFIRVQTNECITDNIDTSINKQQELAECTYSGEKRALPAGCLFVARYDGIYYKRSRPLSHLIFTSTCKIFCYLLSLDATKSKEHLQQIVGKHFSQWGQLLCVKVLRDWANRPYSFVQYEVM